MEETKIEEQAAPDCEAPHKRANNFFDLVELIVLTLVLVFLFTLVFRHSVVDGGSMRGTLEDGEHLILSSLFYTPKTGDIIVFEDYSTGHKKPLVKRVIATEGQTVHIVSANEVYVDGVRLSEDYVYVDGLDTYVYPIDLTVDEGCLFVMGDHRNSSSDSRDFGEIHADTVLGKVVLRIYPFPVFGTVK